MIKKLLQKVIYSSKVIAPIFGCGENEKMCPCCGFVGIFEAQGYPPRYGARCPSCKSLERHRLLFLIDQVDNLFLNKEVLHFAPEPAVSGFVFPKACRYITADFMPGRAELILNIEKIKQPDESWDVVICCHVLEHVNDRLALSELYRILRKGSYLIAMVPIIEGWETTYENLTVKTDRDRERHFGQSDHRLYYGRDFRARLKEAGFDINEYTAYGEECVKYGLARGEKVFVCNKK